MKSELFAAQFGVRSSILYFTNCPAEMVVVGPEDGSCDHVIMRGREESLFIRPDILDLGEDQNKYRDSHVPSIPVSCFRMNNITNWGRAVPSSGLM